MKILAYFFEISGLLYWLILIPRVVWQIRYHEKRHPGAAVEIWTFWRLAMIWTAKPRVNTPATKIRLGNRP